MCRLAVCNAQFLGFLFYFIGFDLPLGYLTLSDHVCKCFCGRRQVYGGASVSEADASPVFYGLPTTLCIFILFLC